MTKVHNSEFHQNKSEPKTKQVSVYVDEAKYAKLRHVLIDNGQSFSEWVRDHMERDVNAVS